jgi:hypothetical protein
MLTLTNIMLSKFSVNFKIVLETKNAGNLK